jgi:hypothetical protein
VTRPGHLYCRHRRAERPAAVRAEATARRIAGPTSGADSFILALTELQLRRGRAHGLVAFARALRVGCAGRGERGWRREEAGRGGGRLRRSWGRRRCRREAPRRRRRSSGHFACNQAIPAVLTEPQRLRVLFATTAAPHRQLPNLSSTFAITSNWGRSESEVPRARYQRAKGSRNSRVSSRPIVWANPKPR